MLAVSTVFESFTLLADFWQTIASVSDAVQLNCMFPDAWNCMCLAKSTLNKPV